MPMLFDRVIFVLFIVAVLILTLLEWASIRRAFYGYKLEPGGIKLEAKYPAIFRNQQAQLIPEKQEITYKILQKNFSLQIPNIKVVDVYPIKLWIFIVPILVYDLEFIDVDNERYSIVNISNENMQKLLDILNKYQHIQIKWHEVEGNYLLANGIIRFDFEKRRK